MVALLAVRLGASWLLSQMNRISSGLIRTSPQNQDKDDAERSYSILGE